MPAAVMAANCHSSEPIDEPPYGRTSAKSLDETRVVNYAQWRSREAFEAMLENLEAVVHMKEAAKIAEKFEPHLYEVSFVDEVVR